MPGFIRSPLTDIKFLRSLFDSEMDERLVLKELIQNADDSGATFVAIGCSPGIQEADHPLLKAPALFAVNDGPLREEHARAIISLGLSTKGDDASTVGKFGLGLKSVFFLAEALFFMDARLDPEERWQHPHFDILSPWLSGDKPLHPEWSIFSPTDRTRVLEHLRALGVPAGFAVWIPLRRLEDCRDLKSGRSAPIIPNYPGDDVFSLPQELVRGLGSLLPLLGHVQRIVVFPGVGSLHARTTFEQSGGNRTSNLDDMPPGETTFQGRVTQAPDNLISNYTGTEALVDHAGIRNLQNDKTYWPKTAVDTPFGEEEHNDPSVPHGAAIWQRDPTDGKAHLSIQWSVFLPVESPKRVPLDSPWSYTLTLHGYFFLSQNRKSIYNWNDRLLTGPVDSQDKLRQQWNGLLAREAILPHVLPELSRLAKSMAEDEVGALTSAFKKTEFAQTYPADLTSRSQWVRQWQTHRFHWTQVEPDITLLPLPDVPGLMDLLSVLPDLGPTYALVDGKAPNFSALNRFRQKWPVEPARALLLNLDFASVLTHPEQSKALVELSGHLTVSTFADELLPRLRAAINETDKKLLSQNKEGAAALLEALLPDRVVGLPTENISAVLRTRLPQAPLSALVVPGSLAPATSATPFTVSDLKELVALVEASEDIEPLLKFVRRYARDKSDIQATTDLVPLVPPLLGDEAANQRLSPKQVRTLVEEGRVFRQPRRDADLLNLLQDVLIDTPLQIVPGAIAAALDLEVPLLGLDSILTSIRRATRLGHSTARLALLEELLKRFADEGGSREDHRPAMRLLLHGQPEHLTAVDRPLLVGGREPDLWWHVAAAAAPHYPLGWTVIREPIDFLSERQMNFLRVRVCTESLLEALVSGAPQAFPTDSLNAKQLHDLILGLRNDELLKSLPIFETVKEHRIAIRPGVHLDGGFQLDGPLTEKVTLLKKPLHNRGLAERLQGLAPQLTASDVWNYFEPEPEPWKHWRTLLKASGSSPQRDAPPLTTKLRWWPLKLGGGCAPKDVLGFPEQPESARAVSRLRDESATSLPVEADLLDEFWAPNRKRLRHLLRPPLEQGERLQQLVAASPAYRMGRVRVGVDVWFRAFGSASQEDVPLLALLEVIPDGLREGVFESAAGPVAASRLTQFLNLLYHQAVSTEDSRSRKAAREVYLDLLTELRGHGSVAENLASLRLLNRAGTWCTPDQLTRYGPQFDDGHVLDEDQAHALYGAERPAPEELPEAKPPPEMPVGTRLETGVRALREYIREWETTNVAREQLGAFLALLDGNPELHSAARGYLPLDVGVFREYAFRDPPGLPSGFHSYPDMLDKMRLLVYIARESTSTVANLLGEPLTVRYKDDAALSSLFTERHSEKPFKHDDLYFYPVELKAVDLKRADLDLLELLSRSLTWVLKWYGVGNPPPHVYKALREVVSSSQATIAATQRRLLKAASQTWGRQLGVARDSEVRKLLDRIDQADRAAEQAREYDTTERERDAEKTVRHLQHKLQHLVENDGDAQQALLAGMCCKISEQQYVPDSVPFELLQNADDALREWQDMTSETDERRLGFTLDVTGQTLRVVHHGRPINFHAYGDFDGKPRGFDADLEKMLTLMSSDKAGGVTGHFGLGFKSVFLLSDKPTVLSARLGFSVHGGVYPVTPDQEHVNAMRAFLGDASPEGVIDGTLVELPLRDVEEARRAVKRFAELAPITLSLTRTIRRFRLTSEGHTTRLTRHEHPVASGVSVVTCQGGAPAAWRALALSNADVTVMLPFGEAGPTGLGKDVPNIWVTAPTKEALGLPFLVNAPFPLDPGRAQLTNNVETLHALAEGWAPALAETLQALEIRARDWQTTSKLLGLRDVSHEAFFEELWQVLAVPLAQDHFSSSGRSTLHKLLWGEGGAYGALATQQEVVPTGLPGMYKGLVRAGDPALYAADFDANTVARLSTHPGFRKMFPPGRLVARAFAGTLRSLGLPAPTRRVTLIEVLRHLLDNGRVTPDLATWLTSILREVGVSELREDEVASVWLDSLTFLAQDGRYRQPKDLLTGLAEPGSDEKARYGFAPPEARLSETYAEELLPLFRQLRGRSPMQLSSKWILSAIGEARTAALTYLSQLGSSEDVVLEVRTHLQGTWLESSRIRASEEWTALESDTQLDVLNVLRQLRTIVSVPTPISLFEASNEADDEDLDDGDDTDFVDAGFDEVPRMHAPLPSDALQRLQAWWAREGASFTRRFEERTYPNGKPFVVTDDFELSSPDARLAWMSLFMLGSLHSIGRTRPGQHRDFLRLCRERGWLQTFSSGAPDVQWMGVVREYLSGDPELLEYYLWMQRFVGFYQLGRWLPQYVEALDQADRFEENPTFRSLFAPNTNPAHQGGGLEAPPLTRTLGIGGPFVIRELLRARVLSNEALHPLAYVPTRRVRFLMELLMHQALPDTVEEQSRAIHTFLVEQLGTQGATFGGHFDLPLQALAGAGRDDTEAQHLQQEILGRILPVPGSSGWGA